MTIRVTDSYLSTILVGDLNRSLGRMLDAQLQAGSMRRVNSYADDPRAVATIQRYNSLISTNSEYLDNVTRSRLIVDGTDSSLQSISSALADIRVVALRESSAIATEQSMDTSVIEVDNMINQLMDVLNTTIEGNYIFSGRQTDTPPFVRSGDSVLYQGDEDEIESRTGPSSRMPVNIPGNVFMGTQSSTLGGTADMAPRILPTNNLADLNMGAGWQPGAITIEDAAGNNYHIDLSSAVTVDDLLDTINTTTGGTVTVALNTAGTALEFTGTGPLKISEYGDGGTAASLGINTESKGNILTGRDIRPAADAATPLADIESLVGKLPLGVMQVNWQGTTYDVDLSGATTLGDVQATFNATVPGMELQIYDSSLALVGGSPDVFEVLNADATDTASALGLAGMGSPTRLFGMLEDLKASLEAGDKEAIRASLSELQSIENTVYKLMMRNGGRQKDLDWAEGILRQRDERLRGNLSLEYDADIAAVAADLSRAESSYQASLLVTAKLYQANLMMYLS